MGGSYTRAVLLERLDHVGIAVADMETAIAQYRRLLGREPQHREAVAQDGIEAVMFELDNVRIELVGSLREDSTIARFLQRRGTALHHVAFSVADVQVALDEARAEGWETLDSCPRRGANQRLVAFLHPSAGLGVLTELCQPLSVGNDA